MAQASTGLDATNTFLQALQGAGTGFHQAGGDFMSAAQNLGAVQQQAALRQQMQAYNDGLDQIHSNIKDEVEQRKAVIQFQQKAMIQAASMGANKDQLDAIHNLLPPIPQSAQEAMLRGQMTGDQNMSAAGKAGLDLEQKYRLQMISEQTKAAKEIENHKVDNEAVKGLIEQGNKTVSALESTIPQAKELDAKFNAAYAGLGVAYNPQTKQLMNLKTNKVVLVTNPTEIPGLIANWSNPGETSEGIFGTFNRLGSNTGLYSSSTASQDDTYKGIMQSRMAMMAKQIGVRAGATQKGLEIETSNIPSTGDAWQRQIGKLVQLQTNSNIEVQENKQIVSRIANAVASKSRNPADYMAELLPKETPAVDASKPLGAEQVPGGPPKIPGVSFKKRGH